MHTEHKLGLARIFGIVIELNGINIFPINIFELSV